jgi:hypothetical protein
MYFVARDFRRRFEAEMKTISCRELKGLDLTDYGAGARAVHEP